MLLILPLAFILASTALETRYPLDTDYDSKYYSWGYACEIQRKYSCVGIKPPKVRLINSIWYRGAYNLGDSIYVSRWLLPGVDKHSTMIHEMIHYLHTQHGILVREGLNDKMRCDSEAEAFKFTDAWLRLMGRADLQRGADWWKSYPHCHQFYAEQ